MAMLVFKTAKARGAELPIMKFMADARFRQLCSDSLCGWLNGEHPDLGDTPETLDTGEGEKQEELVHSPGQQLLGSCCFAVVHIQEYTLVQNRRQHPETPGACADCIQRMGCIDVYCALTKHMYTVHSHLCLPWSIFCAAVPLNNVRQVISMWVHCSGAPAHGLS